MKDICIKCEVTYGKGEDDIACEIMEELSKIGIKEAEINGKLYRYPVRLHTNNCRLN